MFSFFKRRRSSADEAQTKKPGSKPDEAQKVDQSAPDSDQAQAKPTTPLTEEPAPQSPPSTESPQKTAPATDSQPETTERKTAEPEKLTPKPSSQHPTVSPSDELSSSSKTTTSPSDDLTESAKKAASLNEEPASSKTTADQTQDLTASAKATLSDQAALGDDAASENLVDTPKTDGLNDSSLVAPNKDQSPAPAQAKPAPEPKEKKSWLSRLTRGLARTGQNIGGLFTGVSVDEDLFDELEMALLMADAGIEATESLLSDLRARVRKERLNDAQQVKLALRDLLTQHLAVLEKTFPIDAGKPLVVMIAGVNGAGKTTSIGKLAHAFQQQGRSVLLAAGDTFRAAAREQLIEWGERNNVAVIAQDGGDPAAVAFDAVNAGRARESDIVMVDTAGRLPTQLHLMEELKKIRRVINKADGNSPHEVLLVVDGNTGQNVISQIKAFDAAIELTGLIVTKLDGTAKGGALAAVAAGTQGVRPVPVYWIGVGEGMQDLQPFVAAEFAQAVVAD